MLPSMGNRLTRHGKRLLRFSDDEAPAAPEEEKDPGRLISEIAEEVERTEAVARQLGNALSRGVTSALKGGVFSLIRVDVEFRGDSYVIQLRDETWRVTEAVLASVTTDTIVFGSWATSVSRALAILTDSAFAAFACVNPHQAPHRATERRVDANGWMESLLVLNRATANPSQEEVKKFRAGVADHLSSLGLRRISSPVISEDVDEAQAIESIRRTLQALGESQES